MKCVETPHEDAFLISAFSQDIYKSIYDPMIKIIYSEKATKFDQITLFLLTVLRNTQKKRMISCGLLRKPQLYDN